LRGPLGDVLDRALAFEPRDRFASAAEMREALLPCRADAPALPLDASPARTLPLSTNTLPMYDVPAPPAGDASAIHAVARPATVPPAAPAPSRLWLVALLVGGAVAALGTGIALGSRRDLGAKNEPAPTVGTATATSTTPAMTSATLVATAPPASVTTAPPEAPAPMASAAPTMRSHGGAARPGTAAMGKPPAQQTTTPAKASAQPGAAQPANTATPRPDFMDQR